ncbi:MAG: hypothetical protein K6T70_14380 [Meiothermus ruber]|uniref:hypothetical protein n=1 Tax=Meiothermus ruber TaxID=277 RepID=UPI0023F65761|nr:hypothetical protein [Meiothermus ruber]MCL6531281.1 hypothetical protein [Meiothermus ruber]
MLDVLLRDKLQRRFAEPEHAEVLRATLNVTSGRTGMKRNEAEKCRMELQKSEIEVEAPENWGAPR